MPQLYKNTVKSSWRNVQFEDQDLRRKWYERNKDKIADKFPKFKKEKYNAEGQFENDNLEALYRNSRFDEKANKAGEEYSFLKNQLTPEQKQQIYTQYNGDLNSFLRDSFGSDYINNERLKGREALANGQFRGIEGLARLVSMSPEARDEVRNILKMSAEDTTENDDELFNTSQFAQDRSNIKAQKQLIAKNEKAKLAAQQEAANNLLTSSTTKSDSSITQEQYEQILADALPTDRRNVFKDRYNNEIKPKIDQAVNDIIAESSQPGKRMPDLGVINKMACERVAEELKDPTLKSIANEFLSLGKLKHMDSVYARLAEQQFMSRPGAQVRPDAADKFLLTGTLSDRLEQVPEGSKAQYVKDFFDEQKAKARLSPDTRKEMFKKEFLEAYDKDENPEDIFKNSGLELKKNKVLETIEDLQTSIGGSVISHLLPIKVSPTTIYAGKKIYDKLVLKDKLAKQYAEEKEKQWQRDHTIIPEKENKYKDVDTVEEFKYVINELSPTYSEWNGSNWMPLTEKDYENMFQEVEPLLKKGQIDSATWAIDEYLNDIIGEHQEYLHPDNKGHHGKINSSFRQSGAMALETASYYATSLPSLLWGMTEAVVDPSEMQLDAGYNWWERSMYNTIHNDWLGVLSNTSVHELANDIQENADVYGDGFRTMVLKALPSVTASAVNGACMFVDIALTRGTATLGKATLNSLSRNAIKAATRAEAKKLISEGAKEQLKLYTKKIAENTPLLKANYAEAVQQGIETEETIHRQANELKKSVVSQIIAEHVDDFANDTENRYPYTMDDIDAAIMQLPKQQQQRFMNAINGDPGLLSQQEWNDLVTTAKAIHTFNELVPNFDEKVDAVAGLESMTETQIATTILFATSKLLGGVDKNFLNSALGKKIFSIKALKDRLDLSKGLGKWTAEKFGTKEGLKSFGKAAFNTSKTMLSEAFTEVGQQSYSALGQQFGENSIESFLANHLYGDGSAMVGDLTYDFLSEIDKDRFLHDAALGETVKETLFSTFITPSFGRRGKIKPTQRREGQSWLNNAIQQVHYYNPINLQMANEMFNDMAMAGQTDAFVNSINKYFNDPKNKANINGTIAATNYALEMMKDVITDDDFKFGNDQLSKNIAEAIAMSYAPNDATVQNRRQLIKNMASIKSATLEEKQQAIDGFRKEMQSNPAVAQMTDEQILDQLEEAGKRVDKIYEDVFAEQNRLDEIYGKDRNNWQRRSGMIFGKLMQQHLQEKLDDYKKTINDVAEQVKDKDLGQTTANLSEIDWSKDKPKFEGTISGHDILRLAPANIAKMLDPKRLKDYSEEQQKIIKDTNQALLSADPEKKIISAVNNYGRAITQSLKLSKEYDKLIADETWTSKKIDKTSKKIKEDLSKNRKEKQFQKNISKAQSLSDFRNMYNEESVKNAERSADKQFDLDKAINKLKNPHVKELAKQLKQVQASVNTLQQNLQTLNVDKETRDLLSDQIDQVANNVNNVDELLDISNYNFPVEPDKKEEIAAKFQEILNLAKASSQNIQTADATTPEDITEGKPLPTPTDLSSRDVDTAPPVNDAPIQKLSVKDAHEKINKARSIMQNPAGNGFSEYADAMNAANQLINEVIKACPEGYVVRRSGESVALMQDKTESQRRQEAKEMLSSEDFANTRNEGEVVVGATLTLGEQTPNETVPEEDLIPKDTSLDVYPDSDPRSIKKIAIVTFEDNPVEYAYPIRDEDVRVNDNVQSKIDTSQGHVDRIITVEEYENERKQKNINDKWTVDNIAKTERPVYIDRHTNNVQHPTAEQIATPSTRTEAQQERLNNNITPARSEISPEFYPIGNTLKAKEEGKEFTRLGNKEHINIDSQLEANGAFEYCDNGSLQIGDEIKFIVTQETMPDGKTEVIIWEVTEPKAKIEGADAKFQDKQVLSVLDQTNAEGDRAELISRIRNAYEEAGRPESFLYDKETFKVTDVVSGIIPYREINPSNHSSQETIVSNNLKKGLQKENGHYGIRFYKASTEKYINARIALQQERKDTSGNIIPLKTNDAITTNVLKTRMGVSGITDVVLCVPTPKGYQAVHSVYVMRRNIEGAIDKYKEAIQHGQLGKKLIEKIAPRLQDSKHITAFSDYLRFEPNISESVVFYPANQRLELGFSNNGVKTTLITAIQRDNKWYIVDYKDARNTIDDNNGKGFEFEELCKKYLNELVDNETAGASVQINMQAIHDNQDILDDLIDDGFLWAPDAIDARFGMENVRFTAPISGETKQTTQQKVELQPQQQQVVTKQTTTPTTQTETKQPTEIVTPTEATTPSSENDLSLGNKVKRRKKKASDIKASDVKIEETSAITQHSKIAEVQGQQTIPVTTYENLSESAKQQIQAKGLTQKEFDALSQQEKENVLNCIS